MEPHTQNKNRSRQTNDTTASPPAASAGGGASPPVIQWSEEYQCKVVNGILAPIPISCVPMQVDEAQPESSAPAFTTRGEQYEGELSHRKRQRTSEGNVDLFFKLFKLSQNAHEEQYLLEMHETIRGHVDRSHLIVKEVNGKWKIGAYDVVQGNHRVVPVVEDPCPSIFPKRYELSMQERLLEWSLEKRKRGNGREDKFYYHRARQFRSFVEVTTFILYSCKLKDLNITTAP